MTALRQPEARLEIAPEHVLQPWAAVSRGETLRRGTLETLASIVTHAGFAAAFAALLTWRPAPAPRETEIPVEIVAQAPEPSKPAPKPQALVPPAQPPSPKPDVQPEAPRQEPRAQTQTEPPKREAPRDAQPAPQPAAASRLVAPPPEPVRAATQDRETKTANLVPEGETQDRATREARPAEVPQVLTVPNPEATFAVPSRAEPKREPTSTPAPDIPATAPSATEKLAAALPMDLSAMPLSFRAVLSGNGAEVSAAYKGLVYGRFGRETQIGEKARRQHLTGQVIVSFSIDDAGRLKSLAVLQSSGNPAVDALGLELIRSAAPFPPPPPDAQRAFSPALSFGE